MLDALIQKIKNQYGSKYGLKNQWKYSLKTRLGDFKKYKDIDFPKANRLVFVCAGNICRSPLAEAVATDSGINAVSYGLSCRGGDKADQRAIKYAAQYGLNLEDHVTQNIKSYTPKDGDLLVGMEPFHVISLEEAYGSETPITLIGMWLSDSKAYIHDPFNANEIFFNRCENEIREATLSLVARVRQ